MEKLPETTTLPEILAQLADIDVPPPVAYTPETAGWWILVAGLIVLFGLIAYLWSKRAKKNRYRRAALAELDLLESSALAEDGPVVLTDTAVLVKRTALAVFPRKQVASLFGDQWLEFLQNSGEVNPGPGLDALVRGAYQAPVDLETGKLAFSTARQWIISHHV